MSGCRSLVRSEMEKRTDSAGYITKKALNATWRAFDAIGMCDVGLQEFINRLTTIARGEVR